MSQPSTIESQIEDLKQAGFPVKTGVRAFRSETEGADVKAIDGWLHRWARHAAQNYAVVSKSKGVRFLSGSCAGMPAVVIGIGPSLDLHHKTLRAFKQRAVIIATDAAYRPLCANDIIPDIVMSFDCKREQGTLWEGVPGQDVPMLFDSCAHPDAIKSWRGPVMFYNHWHMKDEFSEKLLPHIYPHLGEIPSTGTVGNMAIQLANILGCKNIATVGMDLCYAKEGDGWRYRCQDYRWEDGMPRPISDGILYNNSDRVARSFLKPHGTVEDPDAKTPADSEILSYRTDPELAVYAKSFLEIASNLKLEIAHCSPWNIFGDAVKTMKLSEFADRYCKTIYAEGKTTVWNLNRILTRDAEPA